MRRLGIRALGLLSAVTVLGCSNTVGGSAQRHGAEEPVPLQQVLPTADEVSAAVGNPLDTTGTAASGSIDVLPNGIRDSEGATPLDCLGAVTPLMRVVYEGGGVQAAAWRDYARLGAGLTVSSAEAGAVRFGSESEASRMFARFTTQWQSCEGTTVTLGTGGGGGLELTVSAVKVDGPVLSAVIFSDTGDGSLYPTEHAVGVAADVIVDVDVAITDPVPTQRIPAGRAADLVRVMLAKIA